MDPDKIAWFDMLAEIADLVIDVLAVREAKAVPAVQKQCSEALAQLNAIADHISRKMVPSTVRSRPNGNKALHERLVPCA